MCLAPSAPAGSLLESRRRTVVGHRARFSLLALRRGAAGRRTGASAHGRTPHPRGHPASPRPPPASTLLSPRASALVRFGLLLGAHTWLSSAASGSGPDTLSTRALAPLCMVRSRSQSQRGGATRVSPFPRRARRPREHTPGRSLNLFVFLTVFFLLLLRPLRYLFCKVPTDNIVSRLLLFTSLEFFSPLSLLRLAVPSLMSPRPAAGFPLVGSSVRAAPLLRTRVSCARSP